MSDRTEVSDPGTSISEDEMVEKASRPTLATLFKQGKDKGLLKPVTTYGEGGT